MRIFSKFTAIFLVACGGVAFHGNSLATVYTVAGTGIKIFAQSEAESTAYMIQTTANTLPGRPHDWCGNRLYIDIQDKALFAAALTFAATGGVVKCYLRRLQALKKRGGTPDFDLQGFVDFSIRKNNAPLRNHSIFNYLLHPGNACTSSQW